MKLNPRCGNGATSLESSEYTYVPYSCIYFGNTVYTMLKHLNNTSIQSPKHRIPDYFLSEDFLAELEAELAALCPQYLGHRRVAAVEHRDLALVLLLEVGEHLVPIWPAGLCP